jgi:hypothetical protein
MACPGPACQWSSATGPKRPISVRCRDAGHGRASRGQRVPFSSMSPGAGCAHSSSFTYGEGRDRVCLRPGQGRWAPSHVSKGGGSGAARPGGESPDTDSPVDCSCLASARGSVPGHGVGGCPPALARATLASQPPHKADVHERPQRAVHGHLSPKRTGARGWRPVLVEHVRLAAHQVVPDGLEVQPADVLAADVFAAVARALG